MSQSLFAIATERYEALCQKTMCRLIKPSILVRIYKNQNPIKLIGDRRTGLEYQGKGFLQYFGECKVKIY